MCACTCVGVCKIKLNSVREPYMNFENYLIILDKNDNLTMHSLLFSEVRNQRRDLKRMRHYSYDGHVTLFKLASISRKLFV
jgi:hypothetical protein